MKENSQNIEHARGIKSYVLRQGRLTKGQERVLAESPYLLPHASVHQLWNLDDLFSRVNSLRTLEIGFGDGDSLAAMAKQQPERDFLGVEVHRPGVGHLLLKIEELGLTNVRVIDYDAIHIIDHCLPANSVDCVQIFFPDPWHKKKHNKRRIIQLDFMDKIKHILDKNGKICLATDWQPYAEHMREVLSQATGFINTAEGFITDPVHRITTKFEKRGVKLGHGVWDLIFKKIEE